MKKIISLLILISMLSSVAFADQAASTAVKEAEANVQLFMDIDAQELTSEEMEEIEGEGIATGVAGAIVGSVAGGVYESARTAIRMVRKKETRSSRQISKDIKSAMVAGAITGSICAYIPLP